MGRVRTVMHRYSLIQANARFHRMYMDAAKVFMWKATRDKYTDASGNLLTDRDSVTAMREEVAALDRALGMSHDMDLSGISNRTRSLMNIVFTAPTMYSSFANQTFNRKGWKHIANYAAGYYMGYAASAILAGMLDDEEGLGLDEIFARMDPRHRYWLNVDIKVGGRTLRIGLSSFYKSLAKSTMQSFDRAQHALMQDEAYTLGDIADPWMNFVKGRRSPVLATAASLITDEDFFGNVSTFEKSLMQMTPLSTSETVRVFMDKAIRKLGGGNIPFDAASFQEEQRGAFSLASMADVAISFFGLSVYGEQQFQEMGRVADKRAKEMFGKPYDELNRTEQYDVVYPIRDMHADEVRPPNERNWEKYSRQQMARFRTVMPGEMKAFLDEIGYEISPVQAQVFDTPSGKEKFAWPMSAKQKRAAWQMQVDMFEKDVAAAKQAYRSKDADMLKIHEFLDHRQEIVREAVSNVAP